MSAFETIQDLQKDLVRKAPNGSVFIAEIATGTVLDETTLFNATTGDFAALPSGYKDLGLLSDAGAAFARSISTSDVTSWQRTSPTRSDVTSDVTTLTVQCQETKLATIGLYVGVDPAGVEPATHNGVVRIDKPSVQQSRHYRIVSIAEDVTSHGEIYIVRYLPDAAVTNFDAQTFAKQDDPVTWPVTFTGYEDDDLGASESWIFGGTGFAALATEMGFTLPPAGP